MTQEVSRAIFKSIASPKKPAPDIQLQQVYRNTLPTSTFLQDFTKILLFILVLTSYTTSPET